MYSCGSKYKANNNNKKRRSKAERRFCHIPLFEQFQHLRRVFRRFYLVHRLDDDAFFVDQVGGADDAHGDFAVVFLFFPDIVGFQDGLFRVREQDEGEVVFFLEFLALLQF